VSNCDIPILLVTLFCFVPGLLRAQAANIFYPAPGVVKAMRLPAECDLGRIIAERGIRLFGPMVYDLRSILPLG
jgi:hypothetical protein